MSETTRLNLLDSSGEPVRSRERARHIGYAKEICPLLRGAKMV